jgi:hypothetical protein
LKTKEMAIHVRDFVQSDDGIAWDIFWEYLKQEQMPYSACSIDRKKILTKVLNVYLRDYGMNRGGNMQDADSDILAEQIHQRGLKSLRFFEKLDLRTRISSSEFNENKEIISTCCKQAGYSATDTMITKILLGLTGNIPAYDRYFRGFLSDFRITQKFGGESYNQLVDWLSDDLRSNWLTVCQNEFSRTRLRGATHIPAGRLIDLIGWRHGVR